MADTTKFQDGETYHFIMGSNGTLYLCDKPTADDIASSGYKGCATIDHIDESTKTIYFSTPLPEGVKV